MYQYCLLNVGIGFESQQSALPVASRAYTERILHNYMSYDCYSWPYKLYKLPKVDSPCTQFSAHGYYEMTGFWPGQVAEIRRELILLPPVIRCRYTGCVASKYLAIFLLLYGWHMTGNWEGVSRQFHFLNCL
jgi:hypothetical protein